MNRMNSGGLGWPQLLERHRVVVLAEAGSGKSAELAAAAKLVCKSGNCGFYCTVQDVAREGLPGCLGRSERRLFDTWKASDAPAWLFIDSVDEAKLDKVRLDTALRRIADGIDGAALRAYIVLSGRHTDWEPKADRERMERLLPVPKPPLAPPAPLEVLGRFLRSERTEPPAESHEASTVVLMAPLDPSRVRTFATANGIDRVEEFIAAIETGDLWSLASRPTDLTWLVDYWRRYGRIGKLAEMLETSIQERLKEPDPARYRRDEIPITRAMTALKRIGAALEFGQTNTILIPDSQVDFQPVGPGFDLADILPDWSPEHRQRLLSRAVFDPATFGRARLHNDNRGDVRSYLAARWLHDRRQTNASVQQILQLLFDTTYGVDVIRPSMTRTAAWLSIWDEDVAREVVARDPQLLLKVGDPASLPLVTRARALRAAVDRIVATGRRIGFEARPLSRLSTPDMAPYIRELWEEHRDIAEVRLLLLLMIKLGRIQACIDIATAAAFESFPDRYTPIYGVDALVPIADAALLRRLAHHVKTEAARLPGPVLWTALERLVPDYISVEELLSILSAISAAERDANYGMQLNGPKFVARLARRDDVATFLEGLLVLLGPRPQPPEYSETEAEKAFAPAVAVAAHKLLELSGPNEAPVVAIDASLRLGEHQLFRSRVNNAELQSDLHSSSIRRRAAFWRAAERFKDHFILQGRPLTSVYQLSLLGWSPGLRLDDLDWVLRDLTAQTTDEGRLLALDAAIVIWRDCDRSEAILDRIRPLAGASPITSGFLSRVLSVNSRANLSPFSL